MSSPTTPEQAVPDYNEKKLLTLIAAVDRAYNRPWLMMGRSFINGFMAALGATVGTTVFFTALLWIFHALGGVDLIKPGVTQLQNLVIPKSVRDKLDDIDKPTQTPPAKPVP